MTFFGGLIAPFRGCFDFLIISACVFGSAAVWLSWAYLMFTAF
jgi:hypothetical protein